jgi:glutamine synthetase
LSQIVAGLDGVEQGHDPGPPQDEPYNAKLPMLPTNLPAALDALEREPLFPAQLGDVFIDYFLKLKRNEAGRFAQWFKESGAREADEPTAWEQNEYFDFF